MKNVEPKITPFVSNLSVSKSLEKPSTNGRMHAFSPEKIQAFSSGKVFFENGIDRLVTVRELAKFLNCSEGTIRNWVWKLEIPVIRLSSRMVRFDLQQVLRWLSERK